MNMIYISVSERTKEIGVRRAMGGTKGNIMMQFLLDLVDLGRRNDRLSHRDAFRFCHQYVHSVVGTAGSIHGDAGIWLVGSDRDCL